VIITDDPMINTKGAPHLLPQHSFISYEIFSKKNLFIRPMPTELFNSSYDYYVTETSWMSPENQIQIATAEKQSDVKLDMSETALRDLFNDIELSRKYAG
jgi:hypothetical protein